MGDGGKGIRRRGGDETGWGEDEDDVNHMKIGCSVKMLSRLFADLCKQMRPVRFQMSESDEMNTTSLNNGSQSSVPTPRVLCQYTKPPV